jgi:hypothetical protein
MSIREDGAAPTFRRERHAMTERIGHALDDGEAEPETGA